MAFKNSVHFLEMIKAVKPIQTDISGIAICFFNDDKQFSLNTNSFNYFKLRHQRENLNLRKTSKTSILLKIKSVV